MADQHDSQEGGPQIPSLKELTNLPVSEWYPLGIQLELEDHELAIIRNNNAGLHNSCEQNKIDMFQKWLNGTDTPSYKQLHEALLNCKMRKAANYLEEKGLVVIKSPAVVHPPFLSGYWRCAIVMASLSITVGIFIVTWAWMGSSDHWTEPKRELHIPGSNSGSYQANYTLTPSKLYNPTSSSDLEKLMFTPGAVGSEVVKACVKKIAESKILPDDNGFLRRIAYVMSKDGTDMKSDGGIWQVSDFAFRDTMDTGAHYRLPSKYYKIRQAFPGIDWPSTTRQDLDKPFFSALAARLYLSNFKEPIPNANRIQEQAQYWKAFYMRGASNEKRFLEAVAELE